ncbi:putative mitochondrial protein AtMg01250 [Silene latifolia]|uniref:putative mitochondrial protein AtMg01250 n=1 Tax=Silene latifolia TaxID=37657 RepID=UPI003D77C59D
MVCVTTPPYTLNVNGQSFGFFHGKRGLRRGDPLSPLLFTICMEYLSRILNVVAQQEGFRFHPICGKIKLNHLLFADDLLMFCKGTTSSIMWLLRGFSTFSSAYGLKLNKDKTNIYFNGVKGELIADIVNISGFRVGSLPFKYLGVPISSEKTTKFEGNKLIKRIVARIRSLGAR